MRGGWIPAVVFCMAVFLPLRLSESHQNVAWLLVTLTLFYLFLTIYFIPYNALMPELAPSGREKVTLSTWLSLAYVSGMVIAAQTPLMASWLEDLFPLNERIHSFQIAIGILCVVAAVFLYLPVISINEQFCCPGKPAIVVSPIPDI